MSIEIRPLAGADEVNAGFRVFLRSMVGLSFGEIDAVAVTEPGRFLGALDGTGIVGAADSYSGWLTVPGGARVPHAAVTHVGVLPTHRRQGLVTRLLTRQLRDFADRGEIVATLRASEAVIYERFGYGIATSARSAQVRLARAALRPELPAGGDVRLVDAAVRTDALAAITDQAAWVGAIGRAPGWWTLHELLHAGSPGPQYVVVHSTDGRDDGYAIYQPENTGTWFSGQDRTVAVADFVALNDSARIGLWRHLLSLDLVDVVSFGAVPLDDPLPLAVVDTRAVTSGSPYDETWLRLVDVEAALAARTYADEQPVVLAVTDPLLPENNGRFEIGPKAVTRTDAAADLGVDVATLAAAYLGGTRCQQLAAVGRVTVPGGDQDAVARLDALFATAALPFCGTGF